MLHCLIQGCWYTELLSFRQLLPVFSRAPEQSRGNRSLFVELFIIVVFTFNSDLALL